VAVRLLLWLGSEPSRLSCWLALALTYAAHAAVWTAVVVVLARAKPLPPSTRNRYWKVALLGPLLTVLLTVAVPAHQPATDSGGPFVREIWLDTESALTALGGHRPGPPSLQASTTSAGSVWRTPANWLAAGVLGTAGLGLLRFFGAALLLRRRLGGRQPVRDPRLLRALERMRASFGLPAVRLTEAAGIDSPLVIGTGEICVPWALLTDLGDAEVESVLAHELAHLERGDGLWFPLIALVQTVLWLQPMNHWAAAGFRHTAELACDDRAVAITGNPLVLARALVQVAARTLSAQSRLMVPMMAPSAGALVPRVARLTGRPPAASGQMQGEGRRRLWASAVIAMVGVAMTSLSVKVAQARPEQRAIHGMALPSGRPDAASQSAQLAALATREAQLTAQLETADGLISNGDSDAATSVQRLQWQQELRHIRAMETWLEDQFLDQWTAWENSRATSTRASR